MTIRFLRNLETWEGTYRAGATAIARDDVASELIAEGYAERVADKDGTADASAEPISQDTKTNSKKKRHKP